LLFLVKELIDFWLAHLQRPYLRVQLCNFVILSAKLLFLGLLSLPGLLQILFVLLAGFEVVLASLHQHFFLLFQVRDLLNELVLIRFIILILYQKFPNLFFPIGDFVLMLLGKLPDLFGMPFFQLISWGEIVLFSPRFLQFILHLPNDPLIMLLGNGSLPSLLWNKMQP
jgi:hypothetical protein